MSRVDEWLTLWWRELKADPEEKLVLKSVLQRRFMEMEDWERAEACDRQSELWRLA